MAFDGFSMAFRDGFLVGASRWLSMAFRWLFAMALLTFRELGGFDGFSMPFVGFSRWLFAMALWLFRDGFSRWLFDSSFRVGFANGCLIAFP